MLLAATILTSTISSASAAFVPFQNCLDKSIVTSDPLELQFVPLLVSATLDTSNPDVRKLGITVYGNVSGTTNGAGDYPPADDPGWLDDKVTLGKISDVGAGGTTYTTMFSTLSALTFTPYVAPPARFCHSVTQGDCPLGPVFDANWYA